MIRRIQVTQVIGWSCFCAWIYWNIHWFLKGQLAPSALLYFTGIPAPSTGMTRSLMAACRADFWESILWNAFTFPLLILYALSAIYLLYAFFRKKRLFLPKNLVWAWTITLVSAEVTKLAQGPNWW